MTHATEVEPELLDLLVEAFDAFLSKHGGPIPARVETFTAPNTCSVTPLIQIYVHGTLTTLPKMHQVVIAYPEGGGFSIRWPLQPGDTVYLIPAGWDIGPWISSGSPVPKSRRRWSLSDVVALPNYPRPASSPAPSTGYASGAMVLEGPLFVFGSSTADDWAALESKVNAALNALGTDINNLKTQVTSHEHLHPQGNTTGKVVGTYTEPGDSSTSHDTGSTRIKTDA